MTVAQRFQKMLASLEPTPAEMLAYDAHTKTLKSRLDAYKLEVFGSHQRGTAVRGSSDRDLMVCFPKTVVEWGAGWKSSRTILDNMKRDLDNRLPSAVSRSDCAVVVEFSNNRRVDLVPGVFDGMINSRPRYAIPDGTGGWRYSAPAAHAIYLDAANVVSGGKLKNLARLLKYLRETRSAPMPLNSFYLELFLARMARELVARSYAMCVYAVLDELIRHECAPIGDPLNIGNDVASTTTDTQRATLLRTLEAAHRNATSALIAEVESNSPEAYRRWNMVFGDCFPKSNG